MYRGATHLNLDEKGRISMPARYREEILAACGGRLVTTVDQAGCLLIYPFPEWERIEAELMARPNVNKRVRRMQRTMVGYAAECDMSAQGRVLIGPALRKFAGLEKQVMLVGQGNKFELWDAERWEAMTLQWLEDEEDEMDDDDALMSLSL